MIIASHVRRNAGTARLGQIVQLRGIVQQMNKENAELRKKLDAPPKPRGGGAAPCFAFLPGTAELTDSSRCFAGTSHDLESERVASCHGN